MPPKSSFQVLISLFILGGIMLLGNVPLFSQYSQVQTDTLYITQKTDTIALSHKQIVPFSYSIQDRKQAPIPSDFFKIDPRRGMCTILPNFPLDSDSVFTITYRYFRQPLKDTLAFLIPKKATREDTFAVRFLPHEYEEMNFGQILEDGKLKKSGSITRGLSVGNAQGSSVTSGMRLQLEGDLGDGLKIVGSITDENIPIQPDGTTQQISDLDKIYIQLQKNGIYATIGDYEIEQKGSRFADIYRNVQGLKLGYDSKKTKGFLSGAVAKGKFHSNTLTVIDGLSGPYRLTGRSGEQFFIVLAGSEKVYLNGKLMVRGESSDYVMDYNTAQITFTTKHVITNITRIVIDFEYTDRYFNRSLIVGNAQHVFGKDKASVAFFYGRDADNPNAPFDDAKQYFSIKDSLALYGDATGGTVYTSGVIKDSIFNRTQAFYYAKDSIVNGNTYIIYVHTTDSLAAKYRIAFSYVGTGKGHYKRDAAGFNQYVYKWVAPDGTGQPTGDFAPVKPWVLPKLLEVYNLQGKWNLRRNIQLYSEHSLSNTDNNRLSSLNDNNNLGTANIGGIKVEKLHLRDSLFFNTDVSISHIQAQYNNLDRVYKAEYGRIWNFNDINSPRRSEIIAMVRNQLLWRNQIKFQSENGIRLTGIGRTSLRQAYTISLLTPKMPQGTYTYTHILAKEDSIGRRSLWQRHEGDIFYQKGVFRWGTELWLESKRELIRDTAAIGSLSFIDLKPYFRTIDFKTVEIDFSFNYRKDKQYAQGIIREKSIGYTHYYKIAYQPSPQLRLQNITSYRVLDVRDSVFENQETRDNRMFNTNLQLSGSTKNKMVNGSFLYEIASEQIAQRDVRFIPVNPGQGEYEWQDLNNDQIQSINEFIYSTNPLQANFVRVVLPTQKFLPTTRPSMQGNLRLDLKKCYPKSKNLWKETVRNFRSFTTIRISQSKQRENLFRTYIVYFKENPSDTALIDMNSSIRQEFVFFQNSTIGDIKFGFQRTNNKQFLQTGDETRFARFWTFAQRLSLDKNKTLEVETTLGRKYTIAENFSSRNFNLKHITCNPRVTWQFSRKLRLSVGYDYKNKKNFNDSLLLNSKINLHKITFENRWNLKERNNINLKLDLVSITQKNRGLGPNFVANYELLESLQPGLNAIWQGFFTYYIFKDLELSLVYEGRAAYKLPVVHAGRVQIRALF